MEEYEIRNLYNRKERTKLLIDNITTSEDIVFENKDGYNEIEFHNLGFQIENIGNAIEIHFKLVITFNFGEYIIRYKTFNDSKPNHSLRPGDKEAISFSNTCPIFPGEIMTIGSVDFGFPISRKKDILENGKLSLELIYTNGTDQLEIKIREIIGV